MIRVGFEPTPRRTSEMGLRTNLSTLNWRIRPLSYLTWMIDRLKTPYIIPIVFLAVLRLLLAVSKY
jgi:hypothetical protein